eukprot:CAMPEP_0203751320 /NCGR_PEP_ID=MMETSP0098-20131031/5412_1 /ASSEMBLY_ACC=CAM_ASM_000208 /TAXON_ID=96639 /ORGANISM=" , Strain NY0313808BC1" /LENGTH=935 /DNA_ID=CAMNT_0050640985 /DNA_START=162 /DNA_END=2966 /DNA_ORIENTATION=+
MEKRRIQKGKVDDLVLIEQVSQEEIVQTLNRRFKQKDIYTYIGPVLLSVNPFKRIGGLYGQDVIDRYVDKMDYELPPHVYAIAENAYRALNRSGEKQCILVSGESGSGKTEATKTLLEYIAAVSGQGENHIKDALLNSNPVLESFGNAKTIRNDNSSRFGKYMDIHFDFKGVPVMGQIHNYLLERPRVVSQERGEQNFHVFYIMLNGMDLRNKQRLFLKDLDASYFHYLGNELPETECGLSFEQLQESMCKVGLTKERQQELFQAVATVLWIGNIEFVDDVEAGGISGKIGSRVADDTGSQHALEVSAQLLGVEQDELTDVLTKRSIVASGDSVSQVLKKQEAYKTRDALAKALYGRTFERLVVEINAAVGMNTQVDEGTHNSIGVLDIYGFEIFESNSFEQLCINYCNEKLQQLFIELTLRTEQDEYKSEGIVWEHIDFFNNKTVCDLIELKQKPHPGILSLLDEECSLLGKVDDITLLKKFDKTLGEHPHYIPVKTSPHHFIIKHYAGQVKYTGTGFLDKSKDTLYRDVVELMGIKSISDFVKGLFPEAHKKRDNKKPPSSGIQFRNQIQKLMSTLETCSPHYIRCLKPNDNKTPGEFCTDRVADQARYLGLLENVKVRRAGFAHRKNITEFIRRYKMLSTKTWPQESGDAGTDVRNILGAMSIDEDGFRLGHTKVFIRKPVTLFALEEVREVRLHELATSVQICFRTWQARKVLKELREKSLSLFGGLKRRGGSFRVYFVGDYVHASQNEMVRKSVKDAPILFADTVNKISRRFITHTRLLVMSDKDIFLFYIKKNGATGTLSRRISLDNITRVTLSSFADGFVTFHVGDDSQPGLFLHSLRKAEIITIMKDRHPNLNIGFSDSFEYASAKPASFFSKPVQQMETRKVNFKETTKERATSVLMPKMVYVKSKQEVTIFLPSALGSKATIQLA